MKCRIAALLMALVLPASAADYAAGVQAWQRGDHRAALDEFLPLAEQGHIAAQENLVHMYTHGEGVEADPREALHWLTIAAEAGSAPARLALGAKHFHGEGVPRDLVLAYAWFSLAAEAGAEDGIDFVFLVAEQMSTDEIYRARVLGRQMYERFGLARREPAGG